jgi:glycosyltransferase involved in cell wall biosynthesis
MDYVMVTNDYVKNRLILKYSNGSRGKLENKIFVNPLPLNRFFLVDDYVNIDDNGIDKLFQRDYFLYVGRIGKEKNLYFLIDVFYSLAKKLDNVFLYIVGDGPEKENLFLYVKSKSLSDRVLFLGYLSQSKLVNLYRNCKGVIFVSKTETLGLAVLEAMACGALIFTLAVEPFISFVKDRGILVDSEDPDVFASKIVETVTDKDLFSILKKKALSYSLQFHPRVFAENFLKMVL